IFAAIAGLELLKQPCKVTLYSDSQYLVKAMTEAWVATWKRKGWWRTRTERPENVDLWQRLDALRQTHQVEFRWVRGHAGNPENEVLKRKLSRAAKLERRGASRISGWRVLAVKQFPHARRTR